jgi:protein-tyrosine phosphatase
MYSVNFNSYQDPPPYNIIIPHLYIGNIDSLENSRLFNLIVNCTTHIPETGTNPTIRIPIYDDTTENKKLLIHVKNTGVLEKIHLSIIKKQNVLVHCHAGMQRSCAVVGMYLMKYYNMNLENVIKFIRSKRSIAFYPKPTFHNALLEFYSNRI